MFRLTGEEATPNNLKFAIPSCAEEVYIFHGNVPTIKETFPPSLRVLSITYSRLRTFATPTLPDSLSTIDLSFNSLEEIPNAVYQAFLANPSLRINLKNNDLWFAMYSDISPSMVSPATVEELSRAHRMNLLSTCKLNTAISILREKRYTKDANLLASRISDQLKQRTKDKAYTWDNKENVHFAGVQESVKKAIAVIMETPTPPPSKPNAILDLFEDLLEDPEARASVALDLEDPSYAALAAKVYQVALFHDVDPAIIRAELKDGIGTCLTGKVSRLVNCLNGFVAGIQVGLSKNEEVANSILVARNRNTHVYGSDMDMYLAETIPAVMQILEDACIPEDEQATWLEYV